MKRKLSVLLAGFVLVIISVWYGDIKVQAKNTISTAESIELNSSVSGFVDFDNGDYYKLTLAQNTYIQMELITAAEDDEASVFVYNDSEQKIYSFGGYFYTTIDNNLGVQRGERAVSLNKGVYYIFVTTDQTEKSSEYTLTVKNVAKATDTVKIAGDQNGYRDNAVEINLNNKLTGVAEWKNYFDEECHWYCFKLDSKRTIYLNCTTPINDKNSKVYVTLYNKSGKSIKEIALQTNAINESYDVDYSATLSAGTYYIGIRTPDSGVPYIVKTGVKPYSTKISNLSCGTKNFTIKWKTKNNITGYQIQYSVNQSFKNPKNVRVLAGNSSKKITGLTSGKKYYVRIRTYKTAYGKTYYSDWSAKSTVTPRPYATSIKTLTAGNDSFTVKWTKKADITGYQVQYSASSTFSGAKSVKVKSGTLSKKITGLKNAKKYYVRVRTYKTVSGTTTYSVWSTKKSVKTK